MRINKPWWHKMPFFDAAGEGAPGGEPAGGEGGEPAAFDWGDLSDDVKGFVGEKTPQQIAAEGLAHQRGATARREQILEGLHSDDDFVKTFSEKNGFMKAPADDEQFMEFAKSRIAEDAEYKHPKIEGANEDLMGMWAQAARESGLPPGQYAAFVGKAAETIQEAAATSAAKVASEFTDEENVQIDNFMRSIGGEQGQTVEQVLSMFPEKLQVGAGKVLAHLGERIGTAERKGDLPNFGDTGGGSMSWADARKMLADAGNDVSKFSPDERAQYDAAFAAWKASKEAK